MRRARVEKPFRVGAPGRARNVDWLTKRIRPRPFVACSVNAMTEIGALERDISRRSTLRVRVMQIEITLGDTSETVTVFGPGRGGTERIIWRPSDGRPELRFDVLPNEDEPIADTIKNKIRNLLCA
jgi:hypothetical protein